MNRILALQQMEVNVPSKLAGSGGSCFATSCSKLTTIILNN